MKTRASISGQIIGGVGSAVSIFFLVLKIGAITIGGILLGAAIYFLIWKISAELKMRKMQKQFEKDMEEWYGKEDNDS